MPWKVGKKQNTGRSRSRWPDAELVRALWPLARRVLARYWLESARLALVWGLAAGAVVMALLWFRPFLPYRAAAMAGGFAALAATMIRVYHRPDALAQVRAADLAGLDGAAVTAFRLLESGAADPWSRAAAAGGLAACRRINRILPRGYPVIPRWRSWIGVALLAALLLVNRFLPNPLAPYWEAARKDQEALAAAAIEAREVLAGVEGLKVNQKYVLPEEIREKIKDLPREIKKSGSRREAADRLERARWHLDEARAVLGAQARRDLDRLAAAWGGMSGEPWQQLAGAVRSGDREELRRAVQRLTAAIEQAGPEERKELAAALFSGSGAVRDPSLRRALSEAAGAALAGGRSAGSPAGGGGSGQEGLNLAAAAGALAGAMGALAETAGAGNALGSASTSMAAVAGSLAAGGASGAASLAGGGAGNSGSASSGAAGDSAGGTPAGSDGVKGGGQQGTGANAGGDSGSGNSGSGDSGGPGTGSGGRGSGGSGAGQSGGGLDLVYTPFFPGGGGEESLAPGQVRRGEGGSEVQLNRSPTALGALRPYQEVYGRYMAEAHDSLSRAPLPPDLENLVWRYFGELNSNTNEN